MFIGILGYEVDDEVILFDVIIVLVMGKNVLLKGFIGLGKIKLVEILFSYFYKLMYSVNCLVDLDVEVLVGYKMIEN